MKFIFYIFLFIFLLSCRKENKLLIKDTVEIAYKEIKLKPKNLELDTIYYGENIELPFGFNFLKKGKLNSDIEGLEYFKKFVSDINFKEFKDTTKNYFTQEYNDNDLFYLPLRKQLHKLYRIDNVLEKKSEFSFSFILTKKSSNNPNRKQENIFLIIFENNKIIESKRIYSYFLGEFGFRNSRYFYIDKNNFIYLQDYLQEDGKLFVGNLYKHKITKKGKFIRYYEENGIFESEEEKGVVENEIREGNWIEKKFNNLTEDYTYLEASFTKGVPVNKWKFYKLIYKVDKNNGKPKLNSSTKGKLLYTEIYRDGELQERIFV